MMSNISRTRAEKLARLAIRPAYWRALRHGAAASTEHSRVPFSPASTIIDVGASRGQFALFARTNFGREARIISFEPLADSQRVYEKVVAGPRELRPVAVGAAPGHALLHISTSNDSSSLLPIGRRQVMEFPGTQETSAVSVPVVALDADLKNSKVVGPCLLKIDVQGGELEVLRGAEGLLNSVVNQVYVECSFVELYDDQPLAPEIETFLTKRGFAVGGFFNQTRGRGGQLVQADVLFVQRSE